MKRIKGLYKGYKIEHVESGKMYIGITSKTVQHRWKVHLMDANFTKSKYKSHLHNAIKKYGKDAFTIKTLIKKNSWEEICEWEKQTIQGLNTKTPNGYNLADGGRGACGLIRTNDFKKKLSKSKKEFYADPEKRKEQGERSKRYTSCPKWKAKQSKRSIKLWEDPIYVEKTIKANKEKWKDLEMKKRHHKAVRKSTIENPEWMKKTILKNKEIAKDPEWRKKVSQGLKKALSTKEAREKRSENTKKYWQKEHIERRKKHAQTMSKMIKEKLKDPEYQKWRKENPPGAKPILYKNKYFRSIKEASVYFNCSTGKIDRDLLKQTSGCYYLDPNKKYNYEVKY